MQVSFLDWGLDGLFREKYVGLCHLGGDGDRARDWVNKRSDRGAWFEQQRAALWDECGGGNRAAAPDLTADLVERRPAFCRNVFAVVTREQRFTAGVF